MSTLRVLLIFIFTAILVSCNSKEVNTNTAKKELFGKLNDTTEVYKFTLSNEKGAKAEIIEYGAIVVSLLMPNKDGEYQDVVLGHNNLEGYVKFPAYFGAIVGRYGNRIGEGKFTLNGVDYQLSVNDGKNHLHGGFKGFDKVIWKGEFIDTDEGESVKLSYLSKDGEEGYPGNLNIEVIYTLTPANELKIEYTATTDSPTILNPTHHSYFNLSGSFENTILDHEIMIDADYFTPVDQGLIPTGELTNVEDTPMDLRKFTKIGEHVNDDYEQIVFGNGYDHNWVLNGYDGSLKKVTTLYEPNSGRVMDIWTDQPGMQFYSGNFLNGTIKGKNDIVYKYRSGLCLEAQHYPDSPNKPEFPSTVLNPGETYKQTTMYSFSAK